MKHKKIISLITITALLISCTATGVFAATPAQNLETANSLKPLDAVKEIEGIKVVDESETRINAKEVKHLNEKKIEEGTILSEDTVDGVVWVVTKQDDGSVTVINKNTGELSTILYDKNANTLFLETYMKNGETDFKRQTALLNIKESSVIVTEPEAVARSISYGPKVKETYKNKYWYQVGSEGSKDYLKIGCVATYRLRTDTMSPARFDSCKEYKISVKACRDNWNSYNRSATALGWSADAVAAVIVANILFPITTIATVLIGIFGSAAVTSVSNMISCYFNAKSAYDDAVDSYATIKVWGTKL